MTTSINTASLSPNMTSRKTISGSAIQTSRVATPSRTVRAMRHLFLKWDLYGVVALMASSAAYGVFALAHVA